MAERERRAELRIAPEKPIRAKVRAFVPARVVDISPSGVQIELTQSLPPKTVCDLRFQVEEGEIMLKAFVRSCRVLGPGSNEKAERVLLYRAGLKFDEESRQKVSDVGDLLGPGISDRTGKAKDKSAPEGDFPSGEEGHIQIAFDKDAPKRTGS